MKKKTAVVILIIILSGLIVITVSACGFNAAADNAEYNYVKQEETVIQTAKRTAAHTQTVTAVPLPTETAAPKTATAVSASATPSPMHTKTPAVTYAPTSPAIPKTTSTYEPPFELGESSSILNLLDKSYVHGLPASRLDYWVDTETHPKFNIVEEKKKQIEKYGGIVCGDASAPYMYLTFNVSSASEQNEEILDILKEKNVKATFFVLGDLVKYRPDILKRIYNEGHCIGNHSYFHCNMTAKSIDYAASNILKLEDAINSTLGTTGRTVFYRPPYGYYSERDLALAQSLGYTTVFWSFAYNDYDSTSTIGKAAALELLVSNISNGAIYQLHTANTDNVQALPEFIDAVRAQEIEFATLENIME